MSGFITLYREAFDHPLLKDGERFRAWFWLVSEAAWKPTRVRIKGETIELQRGELSFAQRFLAEKWGWSKSRVDRFIADLRDEGMIETRSKNGATAGHKAGQGQSIIYICNYEKYQGEQRPRRGNDDAESGASAGQQRGKEEQGNKGTKDSGLPDGNPARPDPPEFDPKKVVFDGALPILIAAGRTEAVARSMIGKWCKSYSLGSIIDAIARCRERPPIEPVSWISQQLAHTHGAKTNERNRPNPQRQPDEPTNPYVRASLELQAERAAGIGAESGGWPEDG